MIKNFIKYLFLFGVIALVLSSCGTKTSVESQIKRTWTVDAIEIIEGESNDLVKSGQQHPWTFGQNNNSKQPKSPHEINKHVLYINQL